MTSTEPTAPTDALPDVATVADLTAAHHGWLIKVAEPPGGAPPFRTYVLGEGFKRGPNKGDIRRWTHQGVAWVGVCDSTDARPGIVGTERHYTADTPCSLVRPITKVAKREARRLAVSDVT